MNIMKNRKGGEITKDKQHLGNLKKGKQAEKECTGDKFQINCVCSWEIGANWEICGLRYYHYLQIIKQEQCRNNNKDEFSVRIRIQLRKGRKSEVKAKLNFYLKFQLHKVDVHVCQVQNLCSSSHGLGNWHILSICWNILSCRHQNEKLSTPV